MPNRSTEVTDQQYQKLYDAVQRDDSAEIEEILKNDGDYLTPASREGHTSVVELLLSQYGFQPNIRDSMGEPLLSQTCASGHTKVAQLLIKSGAKLEAKNRDYQTPLLVACSSGHSETAIMLIDQGANISVVDQVRSTPLSLACWEGLTEVVKLLISKGASVDVEDHSGYTPLIYAIEGGHSDIAVELINAGAMQQMTDTSKTEFFHYACSRGLTPVVELMINKGLADLTDKKNKRVLLSACEGGHGDTAVQLINEGAHLDCSDADGFTPLIMASMKGLSEVVKLLVEKGALMEMKTEFGATAFSWSCMSGHSDIAKFLIEAGAVVNVVEDSGDTPLLWACSKGLSEVALLLIDKGARVNGYLRHTPLHEACYNGLTDVVQSLLDHGADMNETDSKGDSMLSAACYDGHRGVAELLIKRGIPVNTKNLYGRTPLLLACKNGHTDIAKLLIENGALMDVEDSNGQTSLLLACGNGHTDIAELLIENGASMDVEDTEGYSPLYIACENHHSDVAILLLNHGANVDVMPPPYREPSLMVAIQNGLSKLALALIEKGVDLDLPNKEGDPILIKAIQRKMSDVVLAMIHKGAELNVKDQRGHDPSYWAEECELHEVVKELFKYSGSPNSTVEQVSGSKSEESLQEVQTEESHEQNTQTPDDQQMVLDQPQAEAEKSPPQKEIIDYKPYLSKAIAKREKVTVKRTSLGLVGASGTGKTSILNLLLDKPPVLKHCSTPVLRPLKGIWVIAGVHKWREASPNVLHEVVAGSISKIAKQDKDENICQSNVKGATSPPPSKKRKVDPINANQSDIVEETPISSSPSTKQNISPNISLDDLPATKKVLSILESQKYEELANLHFVDVVDSGGQAPFIDIAPALFPYTSVNLVALKLNEDLNSEIEFIYSLDGKMISSQKGRCTTKQLIAAAFSSKAKIEIPKIEGVEYREFDGPKMMVLGTHYDVYEQEKSSFESLEEKNEQLRHTLQDYKSIVIPKNDHSEDIIFPLNALSRDEEAQHIAKEIRQLISHCHIEVPIPVNWYLFHIAIEELKSQERDIIPISFFYKIGEEHNMEEKEVKSALQYLHDLNVCLYYPNVLPDVVFTSPHYLFGKISNILAVSMGKNEELLLDMKTQEQLKNEGALKKSMLTRLFSSGFDDDLFSVDQFLELMQHLYIISPLPKAGTYFMPCVLEADKDSLKKISHSAEEPLQPLLLSWKNAVPNGLFPSLVTWLMSKGQRRFKMQSPEKHEQYRNNVTFHCPSIACYVSLFEYPTFIGVSSTCDPNFLSRCAEVRDTVLKGISCIVKKFNWTASVANPEEAYLCNMSECSLTSYHLSTPDDEYRLISCSVNGCTAKMTDAHLAWYHNRTAGLPNAIYEKRPQCTHVFMLLKDKSTKWNTIGRALEIPFNKREEFDSSGKDDDDCLENVIEYWLETECCTPVTWSGLLKLLKSDKLKYIDVARKLEEFLQTDEARKKYL